MPKRKIHLWRAIIISILSVTAFAVPHEVRNEVVVSFEGTNRYGPVPIAFLETAVAKEPVIAIFSENGVFEFFERRLEGSRDTVLAIGASADVLYAACLAGNVRFSDEKAEAGQMFLWVSGI
uniref:Uncharacterized protein n=1 Tax=Candidatus Kentrum sp. LPFa TaxID=2126335 RepID=A0A450VVA0_9GAMM|nr:MAG: hypothetical protein BECKLPF1236A_GA0070988_1002010 [Candidatus Kentron sp. LPFa]VFK25844.1 MAG: hypothetical protein BECKLPF1236C_GA0070990_1002611 [Candidatus Kentron sp. LPFa]